MCYKTGKSDFALLQHPSHTSEIGYMHHFYTSLGNIVYPPYLPILFPSDYHVFSSMSHSFSMKLFDNYGDVEKCLNDWVTSKDVWFFCEDNHNMQDKWKNDVASDATYFE